MLTEIGPVTIEVPRDTESTFEPQIVKKRQRRLTGIDEIVLSLSAKGLTTGEIAALPRTCTELRCRRTRPAGSPIRCIVGVAERVGCAMV